MRLLLAVTTALALLCTGASSLASAAAPRERQVYARSASAILPSLLPFARLRAGDRSVTLRARTAADATIRVEFQTYCLSRSGSLRRKQTTAQGKGTVTAKLRVPRRRGFDCSVSASVRTTSRPSPATGRPPPIRLSAAVYARR